MMEEITSRIYYVSPAFVVMGDPHNGNAPVIVCRNSMKPNKLEVQRILRMCGMELIGEASCCENGLWCHHVREVRR